jgi:hypothetical protein
LALAYMSLSELQLVLCRDLSLYIMLNRTLRQKCEINNANILTYNLTLLKPGLNSKKSSIIYKSNVVHRATLDSISQRQTN